MPAAPEDEPEDEHVAAAKAAGLVYVTDAQPGIGRRRDAK